MGRFLATKRPTIFYGWIALGGAILVYFAGAGAYYSYGVFLAAMCDTMGWTRGSVAGAQTGFYLVGGLLAPVVGFSVKKFGPRKNIILGNVAMILGLGALSQITERWHLYLFFSFIAGPGFVFGQMLPTTTIASNWFSRRRPLALSLLITSGGIGGLIVPPIVAWVISTASWRVAWLFLAGMFLVFTVVIPGLVLRNKPEDVGQEVDGVPSPNVERLLRRPRNECCLLESRAWKVSEAMRTRAFWLTMGFVVAFIFALETMVTHQVAYLEDLGYSEIAAATASGLLPGMSTAGRLIYGFLAVKFKARHITIASLGSMLIAVLLFMSITIPPLVYTYVVIFGISYGMLVVVFTDLLAGFYGRAIYPQLLGWVMLFYQVVGATGPWIAGAIYDATGAYTLAFIIVASFLVVGLICALRLRFPTPRTDKA